MKKRTYIQPNIEVHMIVATIMLDGSKVYGGSMPPSSQMSKGRDLFDELDNSEILW